MNWKVDINFWPRKSPAGSLGKATQSFLDQLMLMASQMRNNKSGGHLQRVLTDTGHIAGKYKDRLSHKHPDNEKMFLNRNSRIPKAHIS